MRWLGTACIIVLLLMLAGTANAVNVGEKPGHFDITYTTVTTEKVDDAGLLNTLEGAYGYVNGFFGTLPRRAEVIIVDDKAMDEVGGQVDSFSAWNKMISAIVLRQKTLKDNASLNVLARHELTHLAINEILCKKDAGDFHWVEEGICTVISKEPLDDATVSKYIVSHGFLNTVEIADTVKNENCTASKNGCMQSYSLVKYITQRYGIGAIIELINSPETSFEKAFMQCTGEEFPTFYKEWESDVKKMA
jgi:hypothetical protein